MARRWLLLFGLAAAACGGESGGGERDAPPELQGGGEPVAAIACGTGFEADDEGGCVPILPAEACPPGTVALPGESACHGLMDCGEGPWGNIDRSGPTQHVDASYPGTDSDGSESRPWTTIDQAVDAAAFGDTIAIAAGTYVEDVWILGKRLRVLGRCPDLVSVQGTGQEAAAMVVAFQGSDGSELRGFSVTGPLRGMALSGASDVLVSQVRVHDVGETAFEVNSTGHRVSVTLDRVLVEGGTWVGLQVYGAEVQLIDSVVRDTHPNPDGAFGRGLDVEDQPEEMVRSAVALERVVVERNHEVGVFIAGSDATIVDSLIQDTLPRAQDMGNGRGIDISDNGISLERSIASVERTVVRGAYGAGLIVVGSEATVSDVVVEDVAATGSVFGDGISAEMAPDTLQPSILTLTDSLVRRIGRMGVLVYDSQASLDRLRVQDAVGLPDGSFGDGVAFAAFESAPSSVLFDSVIRDAHRAGVVTFGDASATVSTTEIACATLSLTASGPEAGLVDGGGNACGCGDVQEVCKILSETLAPPTPVLD